jgi:hypothetical protein
METDAIFLPGLRSCRCSAVITGAGRSRAPSKIVMML